MKPIAELRRVNGDMG